MILRRFTKMNTRYSPRSYRNLGAPSNNAHNSSIIIKDNVANGEKLATLHHSYSLLQLLSKILVRLRVKHKPHSFCKHIVCYNEG